MNAEIISVGTELLLGEIVNTDARMISEGLSSIGSDVFYHTVVGDNPGRVKKALEIAKDRADILITTGGLGPTFDDLTKETIAETFGKKLILHEDILEEIRERFRKGNKPMSVNNEKQAYLPEDAVIFPNVCGTAPGCAVEEGGKTVVMLPGPPRECTPMFENEVLPWLRKKSGAVICSSTIHVMGLGESSMEQILKEKMEKSSNPSLAPYAKEGESTVRVTAKAASEEEARAMIKPVVEDICQTLGNVVYGVDVPSLEWVVVHGLIDASLTLSAAESCTGGLLAKKITDVPGSSACFSGGITSYTKKIKTRLLGVSPVTILEKGVVSEETAREMAERVRAMFQTDIGIGITGCAGPGEDDDHNPEGLIYVALADPEGTEVRELRGSGLGRERNRNKAAQTALDMIRRRYLSEEIIYGTD